MSVYHAYFEHHTDIILITAVSIDLGSIWSHILTFFFCGAGISRSVKSPEPSSSSMSVCLGIRDMAIVLLIALLFLITGVNSGSVKSPVATGAA